MQVAVSAEVYHSPIVSGHSTLADGSIRASVTNGDDSFYGYGRTLKAACNDLARTLRTMPRRRQMLVAVYGHRNLLCK